MDEDAYRKYNKPEKGAQPGVYTHPNVPGEELHAASFPAADAFVRQGWVRKGDLPKRNTDVQSEPANKPLPEGGETYTKTK